MGMKRDGRGKKSRGTWSEREVGGRMGKRKGGGGDVGKGREKGRLKLLALVKSSENYKLSRYIFGYNTDRRYDRIFHINFN